MHSKGARVHTKSNSSIYNFKSPNKGAHINAQYRMMKQI